MGPANRGNLERGLRLVNTPERWGHDPELTTVETWSHRLRRCFRVVRDKSLTCLDKEARGDPRGVRRAIRGGMTARAEADPPTDPAAPSRRS